MKMPFKPRDIEAVKITGYNLRTVWVNRFSRGKTVEQKLADVDICSGGDDIIQLSDKRILLEDAPQVSDEPIGSHRQYSNTILQDDDI